jgi:hypothetical protein
VGYLWSSLFFGPELEVQFINLSKKLWLEGLAKTGTWRKLEKWAWKIQKKYNFSSYFILNPYFLGI